MDKLNELRFMEKAMEGKLDIRGTVAELTEAFRSLKRYGAKAKGRISVAFTDRMAGLNVRSVYGNTRGMFSVFNEFSRSDTDNLKKPFVDFERGVVCGTNGWQMLLCDIPAGATAEDYKAKGFADESDVQVCWWNAMPPKDREVTDYNLSCMKRIAVIERGGELHNMLMAMAACAKAYEYEDAECFWHTLYGWFGEKLYNIRSVAKVVDAVFKMGVRKVGLYEQTGWAGEAPIGSTPLHVVGIEANTHKGLPANNARGLVMPVRHYGIDEGTFVFPVEHKAADAA